MRKNIPVALVGFGSQGRRTAQAITCQEDMEVIGIALNQPDLSAHLASKIGYRYTVWSLKASKRSKM